MFRCLFSVHFFAWRERNDDSASMFGFYLVEYSSSFHFHLFVLQRVGMRDEIVSVNQFRMRFGVCACVFFFSVVGMAEEKNRYVLKNFMRWIVKLKMSCINLHLIRFFFFFDFHLNIEFAFLWHCAHRVCIREVV